jgi:hypothetical protein
MSPHVSLAAAFLVVFVVEAHAVLQRGLHHAVVSVVLEGVGVAERVGDLRELTFRVIA